MRVQKYQAMTSVHFEGFVFEIKVSNSLRNSKNISYGTTKYMQNITMKQNAHCVGSRAQLYLSVLILRTSVLCAKNFEVHRIEQTQILTWMTTKYLNQ